MSKICAIYDTDEYYAKRLMSVISKKKHFFSGVWLFTRKEELTDSINKIDVLLIGEMNYDISIKERYTGKIVMLTENEESIQSDICEENVLKVYKYQAVDEIVKALIQSMGRIEKSVKNVNIVGIYSFADSEVRTSFSMNMAKAYSLKNKTLYINLDEFSGLLQLLPPSNNMTLSDALYYYRQNKEQITEVVVSGICTINDVDYISPVLSADDIAYIDSEQMLEFIRKIAKEGQYDTVVLDISQGVKQQWKMLAGCTNIYMPVYDEYLLEHKVQNFEVYFIELGMENILANIRKVEVKKEYGRLDENFWTTGANEPMYRCVEKLIS